MPLAAPATELLEQISRMPAGDPYAMQIKQMVQAYAQAVVAENERLNAQLDTLRSAYAEFDSFDFTDKSAAMELALKQAFGT